METMSYVSVEQERIQKLREELKVLQERLKTIMDLEEQIAKVKMEINERLGLPHPTWYQENHTVLTGAAPMVVPYPQVSPLHHGPFPPMDSWIGNKPSRLQAYPKEAGWV